MYDVEGGPPRAKLRGLVGGSASKAGGMVGVGRPSGLQSSVAGDVNPRDGGYVCMVAARGLCAPEYGTRRREKEVRDSGE